MKQYITVEQLKELPEMNMLQFSRTFNIKNLHDKVVGQNINPYELITIGKMIEILGCDLMSISHNPFGVWNVEVFQEIDLDSKIFKDFPLCNALWKAVKEKLMK